MAPELAKTLGGKKFMWDGRVYGARKEAEDVRDAYCADAFEIQLVECDGKYLLYTRRAVKQQPAQ